MSNLTATPWRISQFEIVAKGKARVIMGADGFSVAYINERTEEENNAIAELIVESVNKAVQQ